MLTPNHSQGSTEAQGPRIWAASTQAWVLCLVSQTPLPPMHLQDVELAGEGQLCAPVLFPLHQEACRWGGRAQLSPSAPSTDWLGSALRTLRGLGGQLGPFRAVMLSAPGAFFTGT